jgi:hypothetical protein
MNPRSELIEAEMQSLRASGFWLCQWGVALLVTTELILVYIRRSSYANLLATKRITEGQMLPFPRHVLGTILLAVIAVIFTSLTILVSQRYRFYRGHLERGSETAIPVPAGVSGVTNLIAAMFLVFPVLDLVLWFYTAALAGGP